jgi:hypothetical protein
MSTDRNSPDPQQAEAGSVRYNAEGKVEFYDGTEWKPYGAVVDTDEPPVFRDETQLPLADGRGGAESA